MAIPLTDDRWRRLETLFHAAVELAPGERERFVARETGGDLPLAHELAGMLAHHADASARISAAIEGAARDLPPVSEWVGRRCGAYLIVREIGRGGMGLVFETVRADEEYRKTVALKIAPPWTNAATVRERFRFERQILAQLEHPNIARFLDGGTEDGVPYFVMEYVDGVPIDVFCKDQALDLRARLSLFRQVCAAVDFAHESLVVHRDLKPSNILVTREGTPKLLDFGIAKLLTPLLESEVTATVEARWTPDYTSPEQVRGRAVTTRTDVYSLGLILYELLTDQRAQVADSSSPLSLERSICEAEPLPPSVRAAAAHHPGWTQLRGDLDTIVLAAIQKEPERRYGSAAALSDDLGRFLAAQPVQARPSTTAYRAAKFLRRHKVGAAAGAIVVLSLAVGLGVAVFEARRADRRFQQVRSLANAFVFDVHDRIEQLPGSTDARKSIVQTGLVYLESLREDASRDPALARELAAAYLKIGTAQGAPLRANLGDTAGAIVSFGRAQALVEPLVARGDREARRLLISVLLQLAIVREGQGKDAETATALARTTEVGERLVTEMPSDTQLLSLLSDAYSAIARNGAKREAFAQAERASRRSLELTQRLLELAPANREYRDDAATAYNALGQTLHAEARLTEALDLFRSSVRIREQLVAEEPDNAEFRRKLMVSYGNLGDALGYQAGRNAGDVPGARAAFEKAAAMADWARSKDPHDRRALFDLVNAKLRLGSLQADEPSTRQLGLRQLEEAEGINRALATQDPGSNRFRSMDMLIGLKIGETLAALGRTDQALQRLESVRTGAGALPGPAGRNTLLIASLRLAEQRALAGRPDAVTLADDVARELVAGPLLNPFVDALGRADLGRLYARLSERGAPADRDGLRGKAASSLEDALAHWRTVKLAPAVEPRRTSEIADLEGVLARLSAPRASHGS